MDYTVILVDGANGSVGHHDCATMHDVVNWIMQAQRLRPGVLSVTIINNSVVSG